MNHNEQQPVLIVGAGPTGLALALTLLTNGVPVRIIRKEQTFAVGSRGAGVQPRTQELLKLFNVWDDMEKRATLVYPVTMHSSPQGPQPLKTVEMCVEMEDKPEYYRINVRGLDQDVQEEIYRSHLKNRFNVEVELGTEFRSLEQHPDWDYVIAHLVKHNPDGSEVAEEARSPWVIGADGGKSQVRKQLGLQFLGETVEGGVAVLGDIKVRSGFDPKNKSWNMWGNPQTRLATLRPTSTEGGCTFVIGGQGMDTEKISSSREEFVKAFHDVTGRTDIEFGEVIWMNVWRMNVRMVQKFREGRVFIAGDAAHTHSPSGGQGMNSSVQDAINLGWKLALVQRNLAPASLLDTYNTERLPVIASMLGKTTELFRKTFNEHKSINTTNGTNSGEKEGHQSSGWHRDFQTRMFGVNYRGSPIVLDERFTNEDGARREQADPYRSGYDGLEGGDRAPEAPGLVEGMTMTSLYEIFKPNVHTVLVFGGGENDCSSVVEWLGRLPVGTVQIVVVHKKSVSSPSVAGAGAAVIRVLEDGGGYAYKHYRIDEENAKRVVVVRPDAYVGAFVEGVEGLKAYFEKVLICS